MGRVRVVSLLAAMALMLSTPLFAQQGTAEISGKVTDEQGAVLPGVAIVVTNEDTGVFREVDEQRGRHLLRRRSSCPAATRSSPS